ncbi:hypothetical protein SUGI_0132210 [Cryptomeria japonica]|nr:hypothetical protein SUGI_0132210 [Cryptomeria japonica]
MSIERKTKQKMLFGDYQGDSGFHNVFESSVVAGSVGNERTDVMRQILKKLTVQMLTKINVLELEIL